MVFGSAQTHTGCGLDLRTHIPHHREGRGHSPTWQRQLHLGDGHRRRPGREVLHRPRVTGHQRYLLMSVTGEKDVRKRRRYVQLNHQRPLIRLWRRCCPHTYICACMWAVPFEERRGGGRGKPASDNKAGYTLVLVPVRRPGARSGWSMVRVGWR